MTSWTRWELIAMLPLACACSAQVGGTGILPGNGRGNTSEDPEVTPEEPLDEPEDPELDESAIDEREVPGACLPVEEVTIGGAAPEVVYLNRFGGSYTHGVLDDPSRNEATALNRDEATIPAWTHGDDAWITFTDCVRGAFADFDIPFTEQDPGETPHIEVVVGGLAEDIGFDDAGGYAPVNCTPASAIAFVFSERLETPDFLAATTIEERAILYCTSAAHEIGHTFGLSHVSGCRDLMGIGEGCPWEEAISQVFDDEAYGCEEAGGPVACDCGGDTQSSRRALEEALRPREPRTPRVELLEPALGDVVSLGFTIRVQLESESEIAWVGVLMDGNVWNSLSMAPWTLEGPAEIPAEGERVSIEVADLEGNTTTASLVLEPTEGGFRVAQVPCQQ